MSGGLGPLPHCERVAVELWPVTADLSSGGPCSVAGSACACAAAGAIDPDPRPGTGGEGGYTSRRMITRCWSLTTAYTIRPTPSPYTVVH